jgi:hypothetical protein
VNVIDSEDIPPLQAREGRLKCRSKGTVVDANRQGIYGTPERAITNENSLSIHIGPCLDHARKEDSGA